MEELALRLSTRAANVSPSATLAISRKAGELRAKGVDVIGFGAGEPDFDTPAHIAEAAATAVTTGDTRYAPKKLSELHGAICDAVHRATGVSYSPKQVLVSCGAKHTLYTIVQALVDPGDEVILFAPYWVTYPEQVALAGGTPVVVETSVSDDFAPDLKAVRAAITDRTRAIIVNSPSNPCGSVYDPSVLEGLAEIAVEHDLIVISDEIYDRLTYDGQAHRSILQCGDEMVDRTVYVNGASKTYAMTGWRLGWALGPERLIGAMADLQDHCTSNPASFAIAGCLAALTGPQECVEAMRSEFERRRDFMYARLSSMSCCRVSKPRGAFYALPDFSPIMGTDRSGVTIKDSVGLAEFLLENAGVAVVPGTPFGAPACARLSFATSMANIERGLDRIERALC